MLTAADPKPALRAAARLAMQACDPRLGSAVGDRILASGRIEPGCCVGGVLPLGCEIDMSPLLLSLRAAGHIVALPRTPARGTPLAFHRWSAEDVLQRERFGTMTSDGPTVAPDLLLVPLLAFDRRCHRLGYGGGYYDRTIAAHPAIRTVGCAYAAQEVPEIPAEPTDMALDCIATEHEIIIR